MSTVQAHITEADSGGFRAIASTTDQDRDNEVLDAYCFAPLPADIPVHRDHKMSAENLVAIAVPSYVNGSLMIDATFASTPDAQVMRQKVLDGVLNTVSVAFINPTRKSVNGVIHVTSAELISVDLVSVPSTRAARVLSVRSHTPPRRDITAWARKEALRALVEVELYEARRALKSSVRGETTRTSTEIRAFLRSL